MTEKQMQLYAAYVFHKRAELEEDIHNLTNNIRWRRLDYVDLMELTIALARLDAFNETISSIDVLLGLYPNTLKRRLKK